MPKTNAEICRKYRQKQNGNKIKLYKKPGKSSTERSRECRARKKQLLMNNQNTCSNVTDVINDFGKNVQPARKWMLRSDFGATHDDGLVDTRPTSNEGNGKMRPCGSNTELEKFKRRLIRAVARMLLHEKRNEDEVWKGLRKETGCDCKELWNRMRALTLKKLDRLLQVEDRADLLPKPARMSITDWLMFDTVLVHEDLDVTGMKETTSEDKNILVDLFDLVEKHTIEFLAGEDLTIAWLRVTLDYNREGRQCTPMLLQRRWYQLKLATRARFYKFWSVYKGVVKRIPFADPYKPTSLQARIAFRYKPLVVKPFMLWEDLIKNNLVILPEAFERKEKLKSAKSDDVDTDVMCIEPDVETIDLDADSNSDEELEYRKTSENNDQVVIVKQEPKDKNELNVDINTPCQSRQEKILHFAEAVMEATANELDEIELANDTASVRSPNPEVETDITQNIPVVNYENNEPVIIENLCKENLVNVSETSGGLIIANKHKNNNDSEDVECSLVENETPDNNMLKESETVLPQITNIFGGVDVSNENLSKMSLLTAQISKLPSKATVNEQKPENISATSIPIHVDLDDLMIIDDLKSNVNVVANTESTSSTTTDSISNCNGDKSIDLTKKSWFGDLSNDIDFADDGIQLVDDGIDYIDDDSSYQMPEIQTEIESIIKIKEQDSVLEAVEEEEPKVDEKLLMVPMVKTVKLDDLGILPIPLINHVNSKSLIDIITAKTNPIKKVKCETIKSESELDEPESNGDIIIENIKKVKLSSSLLQKPRYRKYNPIQLCKNPDFNTRLKKLNVGFFSSARNRLLLKACKPLSIDVSKAFEEKLVKGTMYLEMNDSGSSNKDLEPEESNQNASVVPSAMAVQSLIDNTRGEIPPVSYSPVTQKTVQTSPITCERNRIINLPDISEIRRINQQLLTAEVTPLQGKSGFNQVPVTLVKTINPKYVYTTSNKTIAGPASRKRLISPQVVDITKEDNIGKDDSQTRNMAGDKDAMKPAYKPAPWKPRLKAEVPWYSPKNFVYAEDTLLALDSLNKMLYLTTEFNATTSNFTPGKDKKGKVGKKKNACSKPIFTVKPAHRNDNSNDDVQVVSVMKLNKAEAKKCRKSKTLQSDNNSKETLLYCCWARERICQLIFSKNQIGKHICPFPLCLCCCRNALVEFIRKRENVNKPNTTPMGVLPLGFVNPENNTDTQNVITVNTKLSAEAAKVMPTEGKSTEMPTSDNPNKETKDIKIDTIETEANIDAVVTDHETNQEEMVQINQDNASDSNIGAEISVVTSESSDTKEDSITISAASTNIIPLVKQKPHVRLRTAPRIRSTEKSLRKQIFKDKYNQFKDSSVPLLLTQNSKVVEEGSVDDSTNLTEIQEEKTSEPMQLVPNSTSPYAEIPKIYYNQKMIYLNSKQISQLPSDNPIFLGKNKILLTTATFPPNFKAFEAFQASIKQTLAVPKGIQLILLPSGRLTYLRDCKIDVSEEFIASLPLLISAIQQQINGSISQPTVTKSQTEVIDLSDDETTNIKEDTERKSQIAVSADGVQMKSVLELQTKDTEEFRAGDTPTDKLEETKTMETCIEVNTSTDVNISESVITPVQDKENSGKLKNILSDLMAMSGIEETDVTSTSKDSSTEVTSIPNEDLSSVAASTSEEVISPVITIEPLNTVTAEGPDGCEEIQPIQHSINPPLLQPINSKVSQNTSVQIEHTSKDDDTDKSKHPKLQKVLTSSLSPITSLSELKYACAQGGLFFKLDLETGLLVPINVCMKKFTDSSQKLPQFFVRKLSEKHKKKSNSLEPKSIIDLTDDDVSEVTLEESNSSVNQSTEVVDESEVSCNIDKRILGNNINIDGKVKPLKLFKSPVVRPSLLERKLKLIQKRVVETRSAVDFERRKLKRKQDLQRSIPINVSNLYSDDSSDDEPLAKMATKIRTSDTEINQSLSDIREEEKETNLPSNSKFIEGVDSTDNLPIVIDEPMTDEPDQLLDEIEDIPIECLDESILDEDVQEDHCILGV